MTRTDLHARFGRLFTLANNIVTIAGVVLTTLSALSIVAFLAAELLGGLRNPYIGIFAYLVLPAIFVLGLLLIPVGMWARRRRLRRDGVRDEQLATYPRLDFNRAGVRKVAIAVGALTVVNLIILGGSSFFAVEHMDSVVFCGETCHTVMQPEYTAYQNSPHSRVACVECHIGPGASWFVKSKLDGLRQVWRTALDSYERPIETPLRTLRPARETCEQCHWPTKHHGDKLRVFSRTASNEANTPSYTALLLKTGGGSLDLGRHGGTHWWHIGTDNEIRYVSDDSRHHITWVELVGPEGEVRTYTRDGDPLPSAAQIESARLMDCVDCHNRPTHVFQVPSKAVDHLLDVHPELRDLPYYKRQAVAAIEGDFPSHAEGIEAVQQLLTEFYREDYPKVAAEHGDMVAAGAELAAEVYGRTVFPGMNTDWTTHPNHIGHDDFPGCWRCHDDEMSTVDGVHTIPMDCENCHVFLVQDSPEYPELEGALEQ